MFISDVQSRISSCFDKAALKHWPGKNVWRCLRCSSLSDLRVAGEFNISLPACAHDDHVLHGSGSQTLFSPKACIFTRMWCVELFACILFARLFWQFRFQELLTKRLHFFYSFLLIFSSSFLPLLFSSEDGPSHAGTMWHRVPGLCLGENHQRKHGEHRLWRLHQVRATHKQRLERTFMFSCIPSSDCPPGWEINDPVSIYLSENHVFYIANTYLFICLIDPGDVHKQNDEMLWQKGRYCIPFAANRISRGSLWLFQLCVHWNRPRFYNESMDLWANWNKIVITSVSCTYFLWHLFLLVVLPNVKWGREIPI